MIVFILTLFAIVKELEENPQIQPGDVIQVDLPIGLPPKHYAELCERYEAYFKRQGKSMISITVVVHIISPLER